MIYCNTGDIILILFPFTNLGQKKQRPALVISSAWYNHIRADLIVLPISSRVPDVPQRDDYVLSDDDKHCCGLLKDSVVKLGKVMTLHKGLVLHVLGKLPEETFNKIMRDVQDVIG
ncbi:type II toxin-antitoxin system PemK/MazF family toxin [Candidatus Bathyarchaeota archaeon]|nr:type II toxin-antitoxin system PemK/MazF family toxin [Candidatus Bathyarchaeota archaeon]